MPCASMVQLGAASGGMPGTPLSGIDFALSLFPLETSHN